VLSSARTSYGPPIIDTVFTPIMATTSGGTNITLVGRNFGPRADGKILLWLDGMPVTDFTFTKVHSELYLRSTPSDATSVPIVLWVDGQVTNTTLQIEPPTINANGGVRVLILQEEDVVGADPELTALGLVVVISGRSFGSNVGGSTTVTIGGQPCRPLVARPFTHVELWCIPVLDSGTVVISRALDGRVSSSSYAETFNAKEKYSSTTIQSVVPNAVPTEGGLVWLNGTSFGVRRHRSAKVDLYQRGLPVHSNLTVYSWNDTMIGVFVPPGEGMQYTFFVVVHEVLNPIGAPTTTRCGVGLCRGATFAVVLCTVHCAGCRAVLCRAVPCCAVPCCAVPCCAVLCYSALCCAVLCCAVLCCAVLCCAVLCRAKPRCLRPVPCVSVSTARCRALVRRSYMAPSIVKIDPEEGASTGCIITLTGTNFGLNAGNVTVGVKPCATLSWSHTKVVCRAPSAPLGDALVVMVAGEQSNTGARIVFQYALPVIQSVSPHVGSTVGGSANAVTLLGYNFGDNVAVHFASGDRVVECDVKSNTPPSNSSVPGQVVCWPREGGGALLYVVIQNVDPSSGERFPSASNVSYSYLPPTVSTVTTLSEEFPSIYPPAIRGVGFVSHRPSKEFNATGDASFRTGVLLHITGANFANVRGAEVNHVVALVIVTVPCSRRRATLLLDLIGVLCVSLRIAAGGHRHCGRPAMPRAVVHSCRCHAADVRIDAHERRVRRAGSAAERQRACRRDGGRPHVLAVPRLPVRRTDSAGRERYH
jgi:hypothetical protein